MLDNIVLIIISFFTFIFLYLYIYNFLLVYFRIIKFRVSPLAMQSPIAPSYFSFYPILLSWFLFLFHIMPWQLRSSHSNTQLGVGYHWWFNYPGLLFLNVELELPLFIRLG